MGQLFRRLYRVRRAAQTGKEITIAPEAKLEPGEQVVQWYDDFVLIVNSDTEVDEELLRRAIRVPVRR